MVLQLLSKSSDLCREFEEPVFDTLAPLRVTRRAGGLDLTGSGAFRIMGADAFILC